MCPLNPALVYVYVFKNKLTLGVFDCSKIKNLTQTLAFQRGNKIWDKL